MNSLTYSIADSMTMLRRTMAHILSNPVVTLLTTVGTPVILLMLMYNLFGGVIQSNGATSGSYINYLTPGMILITSIYSTGWAALRINTDMTQGIIARFRSMSIARSAVLNGHVIGSTLGTLVSIGVVLVLAYGMGFRSTATPLQLLAALGLIVLYVSAVMWLAIAVGVWAKSPDVVNSVLYIVYILPFFSSAFVPTTSMTPIVAWIATNQPFSPIIDTLRALLMGAPLGDRAIVALAWCLGIGLFGFIWSRIAYNRSASQ